MTAKSVLMRPQSLGPERVPPLDPFPCYVLYVATRDVNKGPSKKISAQNHEKFTPSLCPQNVRTTSNPSPCGRNLQFLKPRNSNAILFCLKAKF